MIIKLDKKQFEYLSYFLLEKEKEIKLIQVQNKKESEIFIIEVDEDTADKIRDRASDELQKKGFDLNYELTSEGTVLEELIDKFYINK